MRSRKRSVPCQLSGAPGGASVSCSLRMPQPFAAMLPGRTRKIMRMCAAVWSAPFDAGKGEMSQLELLLGRLVEIFLLRGVLSHMAEPFVLRRLLQKRQLPVLFWQPDLDKSLWRAGPEHKRHVCWRKMGRFA